MRSNWLVVVTTIVFNVPRNKALATVNPASADGTRLWSNYVMAWSAWTTFAR
jgi:uncharacterized membrane protein